MTNSNERKLILEINPNCIDRTTIEQADNTLQIWSPEPDKNYWLFRVKLYREQAMLGFPKLLTIGIGFSIERDPNTNFPYSYEAEEIYQHIKVNKRYKTITDQDCLNAIRMIQEGARKFLGES